VRPVEALRVVEAQAVHELGERSIASLDHRVHVIRDQRERVARETEVANELLEAVDEHAPIVVVAEDLATLDAADHDVMDGAGLVPANASGQVHTSGTVGARAPSS
jgi:phosphoenolpyruvate-protein kinase (PTS system EI component)